MNSGIKKILLREVSLRDKLILYRLVRSLNTITIDIKEIQQRVVKNKYEDDSDAEYSEEEMDEDGMVILSDNKHRMMTINDNDVTTVIFNPPIKVSYPIVNIDNYYYANVSLDKLTENLLMIRRDSNGEIMTSVLSHKVRNCRLELSEYHRVENCPCIWLQSNDSNGFIEIEDRVIYVRLTHNKITASIYRTSISLEFNIDTKQFNSEHPHRLLKIAIDTVLRTSTIS